LARGQGVDFDVANNIAQDLVYDMKMSILDEIAPIFIAGSLRRKRPVIRDIDIVIEKETFSLLNEKGNTGWKGHFDSVSYLKGSHRIKGGEINGLKVEFYICDKTAIGAMLLYATGNSVFNIMCRALARKRGMMLNEYGLFKDDKLIASQTEEEIFRKIGMRNVKPEERNKEFH
jgi:DNA polymerase (family 10)